MQLIHKIKKILCCTAMLGILSFSSDLIATNYTFPGTYTGQTLLSGDNLNFTDNVLSFPYTLTSNGGSTITFTGGNFAVVQPKDTTLNGTMSLGGGGDTFTQDSGTFDWSGTIHINNVTTTPGAALTNRGTFSSSSSGDVMDGSGTFYNQGAVSFSNDKTISSLVSNSGSWTISAGTTTFNNDTLANSTFTNDGTVIVHNATFTGNGAIVNNGSFSIGNGNDIGVLSGSGAFTNTSTGTLTISGISPTYSRTGAFSNSGIVTSSEIFTLTTVASFTNTGSINITGGTFSLPTYDYSSTNTGSININNLTTVNNTIRGSGAASLNFGNTNATTDSFSNTIDIPNITVYAGSNITLTGTIGAVTPAALTVQSNATLTVGVANFTAVTVSNSGTLNTSAATFSTTGLLTNSGTLLNVTAGTFAPASFTNSGLFTMSAGTFQPTATTSNTSSMTFSGTTAISGSITNTDSGQITLSGTSHTISASTTLLNNGANTQISIGVATTNSGTITNTIGTLSITGTLTNGTINNSNTMSIGIGADIAGTGTLTNNSGGVITQTAGTLSKSTVSNSGAINVSGGTISSTGVTNTATGSMTFTGGTMSGTVSNSGTMTFNNGSILSGTINAQSNSTIYLNASVTFTSGHITGAGSNTGTQLIINQSSSGTQSTSTGVIADIRSITVAGGTFSTTTAVSGVNTAFTVNSGATATIGSALSGTGTIENSGTINFNSTTAPASFSSINMYSGSTTNFSSGGSPSLAIPIQGQSSIAVGTININSNTALTTSAVINNISAINIATGSSLTLASGSTVTNFDSISLGNGNLTINNGASLTVSSGHTLSGNGNLTNSGSFTVDNANLTLGGDFDNTSTGTFTISGVPTLTFTGTNFTNDGSIFAMFSESNSLPFINAAGVTGTVTLANGTIIISYNNNYIAQGDYTFLTSNTSPVIIGGYILPQPSRYISNWALTTSGPDVNVSVTRDGFGNHALTARAIEIGNFMEQIGASNPSQAQIDLLNSLEHTETDEELTIALLSLLPPDSAPLQTLEMISEVLRPVELRLPMLRHSALAYVSGDSMHMQYGLWIRPFSSRGHQFGDEDLAGYRARTNGLAFGYDNEVTDWLTLGVAGSISKCTVTQDDNSLTFTNISNYQAMVYGTVKSANDSYLDWILAFGNNNYSTTRNIPLIATDAVGQYSGQQLTGKAIASREFIVWDYYLLTPFSSAQYSFVRTSNYQENGAGPWNTSVTQSNMNLLRLGIGSELATPFDIKYSVTMPAIHAGLFVDAIGGAQDTNTMFISGGPILSSSVSQSRLMILLGASLTVAINDNFELMANYDYEIRRNYNAHEAFLNLRYKF